eukprot:9466225-Pyramimonas_sp.AAC.1
MTHFTCRCDAGESLHGRAYAWHARVPMYAVMMASGVVVKYFTDGGYDEAAGEPFHEWVGMAYAVCVFGGCVTVKYFVDEHTSGDVLRTAWFT